MISWWASISLEKSQNPFLKPCKFFNQNVQIGAFTLFVTMSCLIFLSRSRDEGQWIVTINSIVGKSNHVEIFLIQKEQKGKFTKKRKSVQQSIFFIFSTHFLDFFYDLQIHGFFLPMQTFSKLSKASKT